MEFGVVAVGVDPGCKENVEKAAFGAGLGGRIAAVFPLSDRLGIIQAYVAMVMIELLALENKEKQNHGY